MAEYNDRSAALLESHPYRAAARAFHRLQEFCLLFLRPAHQNSSASQTGTGCYQHQAGITPAVLQYPQGGTNTQTQYATTALCLLLPLL